MSSTLTRRTSSKKRTICAPVIPSKMSATAPSLFPPTLLLQTTRSTLSRTTRSSATYRSKELIVESPRRPQLCVVANH